MNRPSGRVQNLLVSSRIQLSREERRQCRDFSVLLLVVLGAGVTLTIGYIWTTRTQLRETALDHIISIGTLIVIFAMYLANRRGHFQLAASTTILATVAAIFASAIPTGSDNEVAMLSYLAIPIVMAGMLMTVRFTIVVSTVSVIGVTLFPLVTGIPGSDIPLSATVLIAAFVVVAANERRRIEAERRSEDEANRARFQQLATHDHLTGLPNRLLFTEEIERALDRARRGGHHVALLFVDVDDFKSINEALGHAAADRLLMRIGVRLKQSVRASDIVSRQSGNQFCVLVDGLKAVEDCAVVTQKLLTEFRRPYSLDEKELFITGSFGVSIYPADGRSAGELLRRADTALYRAKDAGRDTAVFYTAEMSGQAEARLALAADLQHAIERDEFEVLYQPQVDAATGAVFGFECLARWRHPRHGQISPGTFVPLAEQSGAISDLTRFVTGRACSTWASAHRVNGADSQRSLQIGINISERDLRTDQFVDWLSVALESGSMPPDRLEVELTENILFGRLEHALPRLNRLKDLGVKLAVDDFGAGFATLRQIAEFPIDTIKIDRSFIRDVDTNHEHTAVIAGIVEIANRLGVATVAEGVETREQLAALRALGCGAIQGWYFSRAVSADLVPTIVSRGFHDT